MTGPRQVGISSPTAKNWLSLLITSGIVVLIEPYLNNALKRIIKALNMYFMDTGLCAYLTRWTSSESLEVSAMSGAFFETFVVSEVIKSYLNAGRHFKILEKTGKEFTDGSIICVSDDMVPVTKENWAVPVWLI